MLCLQKVHNVTDLSTRIGRSRMVEGPYKSIPLVWKHLNAKTTAVSNVFQTCEEPDLLPTVLPVFGRVI